jgi:hypothetical protein
MTAAGNFSASFTCLGKMRYKWEVTARMLSGSGFSWDGSKAGGAPVLPVDLLGDPIQIMYYVRS